MTTTEVTADIHGSLSAFFVERHGRILLWQKNAVFVLLSFAAEGNAKMSECQTRVVQGPTR